MVPQALATVRLMGPERAVARLQLEAQVQYRLGNNKDAIQLYSQLFQQHKVQLTTTPIKIPKCPTITCESICLGFKYILLHAKSKT